MMKPTLSWGAGVLALMALAACSLAEDITPPPGIELTQAASIPTPAVASFRPNPLAGEIVFNAHCIQCHGPQGKGDGEMAPQLAAQRSGPLPDFSDPATLHNQAPQRLYITITNGRLDLFMPPFVNELTPEQRWNVIAYLYSFARPAEALAQGEAIFAARCAECHSTDLSSPDFFSATSNEKLLTALNSEAHAAVAAMTDVERQAAIAYARTLAFDTTEPVAALTPTPGASATLTDTVPLTPTATTGVTISGAVTNGSGGEVPADLRVQLHIFDQFQMVDTLSTTVSNGAYVFANVPLLINQVALVTTEYADMRYGSDIASYTGTETVLTLPLEIFETTSDPAVLNISRWHVVFDTPADGQVAVTELLIFDNASNRVFVSAVEGEPALAVSLPVGAVNLQFQEGSPTDSIQFTETGFGYTGALRPGAQTLSLFFSFDLPFSGALKFSQAQAYPVAALNVVTPPSGLTVNAPGLTGPTAQQTGGGEAFVVYSGEQWPAEKPVTLTVTPTTAVTNVFAENWRWWLGGLGAALLALGAWWWLRQRGSAVETVTASAADLSARRAALIEELAQLDEGFAKGEYGEREYQRQRAELKAEALEISRQLAAG